jgi:hypothetical protein
MSTDGSFPSRPRHFIFWPAVLKTAFFAYGRRGDPRAGSLTGVTDGISKDTPISRASRPTASSSLALPSLDV